ncbi:MAG: SLC13 family permease [Treponema sp.]|nr:SLC13 family permease [Treponema sp.]
MKSVKVLGVVIAAIIVALSFVLPASESLSRAGIGSLCVLMAILALLLTDAVPVSIAVLMGPALLIFLRITTPPAAFSGFTNPVVYFILCSLIISYAISSTNLSKRMLVAVMKRSGRTVDSLVLGIMISTVLLSAFMSNVAACVIFLGASLDFLNIYDNEADKKRTGRTLMIALPLAAMTGGMYMPAASSLNMQVVSQLETVAGIELQFIKWMAIGTPMVVFVFPVVAFFVIKFNKAAPVSKEKLDAYILKLEQDTGDKWSFKEKYVSVVLVLVLAAWIMSSWFPRMQVAAVAIAGVFLFFLPGLNVFTWKEVESKINWTPVLLTAAFISMGNAYNATGAAKWMTGILVPSTLNAPIFVISILTGVIVFVMLVIVPNAPALIPILGAPLVALATAAGISPAITLLTLGFTVVNCYLLPFDPVPIITYVQGYYTKRELARTAVLIQMCILVIVALWIPFMVKVLGL